MATLAKGDKTILLTIAGDLATATTSSMSATGYETTTSLKTTIQVTSTFTTGATAGGYLYIYGSQDDSVYDAIDTPREIRDIALPTTLTSNVQSFTVDDAPKYLKVAVRNVSGQNMSAITVTAQSQTWA